jgi:hypothetical protein
MDELFNNDNIDLATVEGRPVLIGESEAWWLVKGSWAPLDHTEAFCKAIVLDHETFKQMFPELPPPPKVR